MAANNIKPQKRYWVNQHPNVVNIISLEIQELIASKAFSATANRHGSV